MTWGSKFDPCQNRLFWSGSVLAEFIRVGGEELWDGKNGLDCLFGNENHAKEDDLTGEKAFQ